MSLETLKEKIEHIVHRGEEIADAEYRKLVGEVLALFHEHVTGEAIAPATVAAPVEPEAPTPTPEAVSEVHEEGHDMEPGAKSDEHGGA